MSAWEMGRLGTPPTTRTPSQTSYALPSQDLSTAHLVDSNDFSEDVSMQSSAQSAFIPNVDVKNPSSTQYQPASSRNQPRQGFRSHVQRILKAFGLAAVFNLLAKILSWPLSERKKEIMKKSRLWAALRAIVHLVPVSAAVFLLSLNGASYYIGGELAGASGQDVQKLAALSFAAKLHELFMLASVTTILMTHIRKELVFGNGLPFGAVFSAIQFKDLTFLWSPELWGTIYHEWEKRGKKLFIISLLIVCSLVGLTVGPSTNVLMRPRLDTWPAGGTPFWIDGTDDLLWPQTVRASDDMSHCATENGDPSCPASGWQGFNEQYFSYWKDATNNSALPQVIQVASRTSVRELVARTRDGPPGINLIWANMFTLASVPPSFVADALEALQRDWVIAAARSDIGNFRYRRDAYVATEVLQPLVYARCSGRWFDPNEPLVFPQLSNISLRNGPHSGDDYSDNWLFLNESLVIDDANYTAPMKEALTQESQPSLFWIDDDEYLSMANSTLLAVATLPKSSVGNASWYCCSIDSRYAKATLRAARTRMKVVSGEPTGFSAWATFNPSYRPVRPTAEWAQYLNPAISASSETNETVFSALASNSGLWNTTNSADLGNLEPIVENILAILLANALGRININASMVGTHSKDWMKQILPKNKQMGHGGNAYTISQQEQKSATQLQMKASIKGYAYSPKGKTQIASMVVLSLYVVLASAHFVWTWKTGWYSTSWGSTSELTALAMNSTSSKKLENTGGGIETINVFKEKVKIRLKDERTQILFRDVDGGQRLQPNTAYA